jgi:hypothetical protein
VVWLLFLAAMGSAGLVHQLAWMVRSKEPIYVVREWSGRWISSLRYQSAVLAMAAEEAHWDVAATRAAFFGEQSDMDSGNRVRTPYGPRSRSRDDALEDLQVVLVPDSAGQMVAGLLFYRDDARREKSGFVVVRRGAVSEPQPALELPATLARLAQESLDQTGAAR